jgi:holin-like protein
MFILLFSFLGEIISTGFRLPVPGSIIGMILLFLALHFKLIRLRQIHDLGQFLLGNMTILFLPASVGIMTQFNAILAFWWQISLIILLALMVNLVVIGKVVALIKRRYEGDYVEMMEKEQVND